MDDERLDELLEATNLDIKSAIQIAKILSNAPEERLPMILDVFDIAGIEISGIECIEALKDAVAEMARRNDQIENLEEFLGGLEKLGGTVRSGYFGIPVKQFNEYCATKKVSVRKVRRILSDMDIIDHSISDRGKIDYSIPVYLTDTKEIIRCICVNNDWREKLGVK